MTRVKRKKNGLCDMFIFICEEKSLSDCQVGRGNEEGRNTRFSNSNKATYCRSFIDRHDSRLLIVAGGKQAETLRQEMKSKGVGEIKKWGAEPWKCGNRSWKGNNSLMMIMMCARCAATVRTLRGNVQFDRQFCHRHVRSTTLSIMVFLCLPKVSLTLTRSSRPCLSLPSQLPFADSHSFKVARHWHRASALVSRPFGVLWGCTVALRDSIFMDSRIGSSSGLAERNLASL